MQKADYSKIADWYDQGSYLIEQSLAQWLELIRSYIHRQPAVRFLDLGCGTGKFSIPIANRLGYKVTGVDASKAMLSKTKEKDTEKLIQFIVGDAYNLPFLDGYFDAVFM
ncbi:methyltransferase domain-containing protein [Paenibacillus sp. WQ 127069]|uniref:Methyltransferase domain-containing protein n=1 Tax=Paenibacillus baimaensis TaxID=2982185 RepID=A0ABT2UI26_9BACL|nr:class I SAM-dependent methyltransferase [Paenibacillus sp. WQ 127069]MCU6793314.1 methyltransferase domain-containing protein [Paenibacillus sp. WQ 127069]